MLRRPTPTISFSLALALSNAGCTTSNDTSSDSNASAGDGATTGENPPGDAGSTGGQGGDPEVATYQELVGEAQMAATAYLTAMQDPAGMTMEHCQQLHDDYDATMRPWVSQMLDMSDAIDTKMHDHGGDGEADTGCVASSMMYELDRHAAFACSFADRADDVGEAERHVNTILDQCSHEWDRCDELTNGLDDGNWEFGPMMSGCGDWDGCCSGMMDHCCMGMMAWMHPQCCDG